MLKVPNTCKVVCRKWIYNCREYLTITCTQYIVEVDAVDANY